MKDTNKQKPGNKEIALQKESALRVKSQIKAGPGIIVGRPPFP